VPPVAAGPQSMPVCRRLRSKGTPGISYDDGVSFEAGFIPTATFWCTATAEAVGPDDAPAHPHVCVPGRICFTAPQPQERDEPPH
jgi:hypothetical protein